AHGPEKLAMWIVLKARQPSTYVENAVCQLLKNKEDISQYGIAMFFTEYFNSVYQGTHILFWEFSFIQATLHNKTSFLQAFWRCFQTVGGNGVKKFFVTLIQIRGDSGEWIKMLE
uniref:Centriolar satellite-associated tubulin polyglutamylase complex regulator 1 n=1 Tax=Catagonus wagneri TaxID=51154 RepID=A0A8C3WBE1_9CETA